MFFFCFFAEQWYLQCVFCRAMIPTMFFCSAMLPTMFFFAEQWYLQCFFLQSNDTYNVFFAEQCLQLSRGCSYQRKRVHSELHIFILCNYYPPASKASSKFNLKKKFTYTRIWCQRICQSVCYKIWPQLSLDWQNWMGWINSYLDSHYSQGGMKFATQISPLLNL